MIHISDDARRSLRRLIYVGATALVFAGGVLVAGCGQHNADDDTGASGQSSSQVIATVNGQPITMAEHYDELQHFVPALISGYPQNPILAQPAGRTALRTLIQNKLAMQLAQANGVGVTSTDLNKYYQDSKLLKEAQLTGTFENYLQSQGYSVDEYKQEVLAPEVAQINLLSKSVTVTPAEIQAAYNANLKDYTVPNGVHIHRMVTATKADADTVYKGLKAGQTMQQLIKYNIAADDAGGNPDDATDVAEWINTDEPAPVLGQAGIALKSAKVNAILPPMQVQGQWWVIQVVDRRPKQVLPFSEIGHLVQINVERQKAGENAEIQFQNLLLADMQHAVITITPPQYQSLAQEMHEASMTAGMPVAPTPPAPPAKPAPK